MSTRSSNIYLVFTTGDNARNARMNGEHSFHLYHEAGTEEYYIVDDAHKESKQRISKRTAKELVRKWEKATTWGNKRHVE